MSNGKERAIALLGTARSLESPNDMADLIEKAIIFLRDEPELVSAMSLTCDMIYASLGQLVTNLPKPADDLDERAKKIHICEAALLQIADYAKSGLKARQLGSMECAENLKQAKINHTLDRYSESKVTITGPDGTDIETTAGQFNRVAEAVQRDPGLVDRVLGGEQ